MAAPPGEAITAVALGGSVSAGHGVIDPGNGWVARIFRWIEDTFPAAKHVLLNQAIPATTSGYVSACIPELVPANTDLVILEYTYNDYVFGNSSRTINNASRYCSICNNALNFFLTSCLASRSQHTLSACKIALWKGFDSRSFLFSPVELKLPG